MAIKAILSDVDGTLIDFDYRCYPSVPALIKTVREKNIHFSLATGRAYFGTVSKLYHELNLSPLHVVNGGGMIMNGETGETPWYRPISAASTEKIARYLDGMNLVFSIETKDTPYMTKIVDTPAYENREMIRQFSHDDVPQGALKILVHGAANRLNRTQIEVFKKHITDECKDVEVMLFSFKEFFGLDVTSEQSTKHTAVLEYMKILGLHPDEVVAIGDGHNDYPLFTACGYRIAMGNAPAELKDIADLVVPMSKDGGMDAALRHILMKTAE